MLGLQCCSLAPKECRNGGDPLFQARTQTLYRANMLTRLQTVPAVAGDVFAQFDLKQGTPGRTPMTSTARSTTRTEPLGDALFSASCPWRWWPAMSRSRKRFKRLGAIGATKCRSAVHAMCFPLPRLHPLPNQSMLPAKSANLLALRDMPQTSSRSWRRQGSSRPGSAKHGKCLLWFHSRRWGRTTLTRNCSSLFGACALRCMT